VVFYRDYELGLKADPKRIIIQKNKILTETKAYFELNYGRLEAIKTFLEEWNK
jgi:hypothetical protein